MSLNADQKREIADMTSAVIKQIDAIVSKIPYGFHCEDGKPTVWNEEYEREATVLNEASFSLMKVVSKFSRK